MINEEYKSGGRKIKRSRYKNRKREARQAVFFFLFNEKKKKRRDLPVFASS